jgi:hypothetical protein
MTNPKDIAVLILVVLLAWIEKGLAKIARWLDPWGSGQ